MKKCKKCSTRLCTLAMTMVLLVSMLALPASAATYYVTKPAEGTYFICPSASTNYALDVQNGNLSSQAYEWLYTRSNGNKAQLWLIRHEVGDWFSIRIAAAPELCLNVPGGNGQQNGQQLWLWTFSSNDPSSLWRFSDAGNGRVVIQNQHGLCLNYDNGQVGNSVRVHLWSLSESESFYWKLLPASESRSSDTSAKAMSTTLYGSTGGYLSCGFDGYKNTSGRHEGIDFVKGFGSAVYSLTDGVITRVTEGYNGSNGLSTIAIYSSSTGKTVIYLHADPLNSLYVGQSISRGQQIATEAWRGVSKSSGTHTHVEVRNGRCTSAAKSVNDYVLENSNPTSFWNSQGYLVQ